MDDLRQTRLRQWILPVLLGLAVFLTLGSAPAAHAQEEQSLYWERFDVDIAVRQDGAFRVDEHNYINFTSGSFRFGRASIPTSRTEGISEVTVEVNGQPLEEGRWGSETAGTYAYTNSGGNLEVRYYFPAPARGRQVVTLSYLVEGGLRYYTEGDQLWWKAVPANETATIEESTVTVNLPPGIEREMLEIATYGTEADINVSADGRTVTFDALSSISPYEEMEVRVQFPHGIVRGTAPSWQAADDRAREEQAEFEAQAGMWNGLFGLGSVVALVAGAVATFLLWFTRGRDQVVALQAEYLSEPPDDLPAGVVGTLIDESADLKDVTALLLDLARKGAVKIEEFTQNNATSFSYTLVDPSKATSKAEQLFVQRFFGNDPKKSLSEIRNKFYTEIGAIQSALYEEVVERGLFSTNPNKTRNNFRGLGCLVLVGSIFGGFAFGIAAIGATGGVAAMCLPLVGVGLGIVLLILSGAMPRKTRAGAESASKWMAFKRYLQNIEKYDGLEEKRQIWDQYLPFAIAFGLETSYIQKFARVDAPVPQWYAPMGYPRPIYQDPYYRRGPTFGRPTLGGAPTPPVIRDSAPSAQGGGGLQGASDQMAGGIQGLSNAFAGMINSTAATMNSRPAPPPSASRPRSSWSGGGGGGFSGGGFSGGGGGGGGSRGFG